ncbi:hypothetical protein Sru01_34110 [Sphaerisporangium rufum]|uniref:Uncharacterized protein n=1 Tax=Sphaerisporangium rufum TaxID=1381558 RepID=A0A919R2C5_9ACTN|nr:hypothetical protein Sru01_34110 [Sphaerisporangium rufum]
MPATRVAGRNQRRARPRHHGTCGSFYEASTLRFGGRSTTFSQPRRSPPNQRSNSASLLRLAAFPRHPRSVPYADLGERGRTGLRFDGSRLAEERGGCYLALGRTDLAESALTEALGKTISLRRKGSVLTDLAMIGVNCNDLDQILESGGSAVSLAEQTQSSGYVGRKLQSLQTRLTPFLADPRVSHLSTRITQLTDPVRPRGSG